MVTIAQVKASEEILDDSWDYVLGVGSWYGSEYLVHKPLNHGKKVVPWLVSNGGVNKPEVVELLNGLRKWFTPSEYCRQKFGASGLDITKIEVIPEAVDDDLWKPLPDEEGKRYEDLLSVSYGLELPVKGDIRAAKAKEIPILLTVGGDGTSKGVQEVFRALAKLPADQPWIYVIKTIPQGREFDYASLRRGLEEFKLVSKLGLEDRVRYIMGEFSAEFVNGLINLCDIYVAPSRSEGFGLPFVQAGMCAKPVVSIDALAVRETVIDGVTGFLVKSKKAKPGIRADTNELSHDIGQLLSDRGLREKMGQAAREHCRKSFGPRIVAGRFLDQL